MEWRVVPAPLKPEWKLVAGVAALVTVVVVVAILLFMAILQPLSGGHSNLPPSFRLGTPTAVGLGEQIPVAAAYDVWNTDQFGVNLRVNAVYGTRVLLPTVGGGFVIVTVGSSSYRVNWTNQDGQGPVSTGDSFEVTRTDPAGGSYLPLPPGCTFDFFLLRSDGAAFTATFSTP